MCTGDASAEDVHPFQSCQPKMNPSDFIFPKGVAKKIKGSDCFHLWGDGSWG